MAEAAKEKKSLYGVAKDYMPVTTAILGFLLGLITGQMKYASDVKLQYQNRLLDIRKDAYTKFIEGQAKLRQAKEREAMGDTEEAKKLRREYELSIKTARFQSVLVSTKPVIDAMVAYFRVADGRPPCPGEPKTLRLDVQIYQNMRREVFGDEGDESDQKVKDGDLYS
ncbi:MAG TPA: hypothetical protein VGG03_11975 [Thermoanaerobaculia bacterium]|jgi:hypothetical protein